MDSTLSSLVNENKPKHILYAYEEIESYLELVVEYCETGVRLGNHVVCIESLRLYPQVLKKLKERLTKEEMEMIHHVNNFDFYLSSGSYHPPAILEYFTRTVQPFKENNIRFQSWAHVEWNTMKAPYQHIEYFENRVDEAVAEMSFSLICAYKRALMPEQLQQTLLRTHPYVYINDKVYSNDQNQMTHL